MSGCWLRLSGVNAVSETGGFFDGWVRNARLMDGRLVDLCVQAGEVVALGPALAPATAKGLDAEGRALSPALVDHHLHLYAAAAALDSLNCAPPQIRCPADLHAAVASATPGGDGWIRAVAYHPSNGGEIDRATLDAWRPDVPVRVQHVSGRRWTLNSAGLEALGEDGPWQSEQDRANGHLLDQDSWLSARLRQRRGSRPPDLSRISRTLASFGVVAVTDTGPTNNATTLAQLRAAVASGVVRQHIQMMGDASLDALYVAAAVGRDRVAVGPHKFHLLESELPDFDWLCEAIARSHAHQRPVAFHCVTRSELVFALAALESVGVMVGDRIEHAGVCPDEQAQSIARLGLWVVTQPEFVYSKGDRYLDEVAAEDQPWLYRLAGLRRAGVSLAASSDAPYGALNPWQGIAAAMQRRTRLGRCLGGDEALALNDALSLYTGSLQAPGSAAPSFAVGCAANLCVLDRSWAEIACSPASTQALLTLARGRIVWQGDQTGALV